MRIEVFRLIETRPRLIEMLQLNLVIRKLKQRRDEIAERGHQTFRKLDMIELLRAIRPENMGIEA